MSMSALMCPHCGGRLLIDPTQRLQSMLTCPYCARKSLMQKKNGMIVLRGIISQANPPPLEPSAEESSAPSEPQDSVTPPEPPDSVAPPEPPDSVAPPESADSVIRPASLESCALAEPLTSDVSAEPVVPIESADLTAPVEPAAIVEPEASFESVESVDSPEPAPAQENVSSEPEYAPEDFGTRQDRDLPASSEQADQEDLSTSSSESVERFTSTHDAPFAAQEIPESSQKPRQNRLIALASQAAASGQVMLFNSYARQAIDCDPQDPRAYALRARLIEEAHGFARATFLSPVWMGQTPRQKAWTLAQHFASFNAAIAYSADSARSALASEIGALIAWQIRESFLENARLRLGKRAFKGRFHRRDLSTAPRIIDACTHVNETVMPHVAGDLLRSVRLELEKIDPRLADQLQRIGF